MGQLLRSGTGVPRDEAAGLRWLSAAAENGSQEACLALAALWRRGEGAPRDPAAALQVLLRAAELGSAEAAKELGVMYLTGEGVLADEAQAHVALVVLAGRVGLLVPEGGGAGGATVRALQQLFGFIRSRRGHVSGCQDGLWTSKVAGKLLLESCLSIDLYHPGYS